MSAVFQSVTLRRVAPQRHIQPYLFSTYRQSNQQRHLHAQIFVVGKKNGGEPWIAAGCSEYEKRLQSVLPTSTIFCKTDAELIRAVRGSKIPRGACFALDELGDTKSSREFTKAVYKLADDTSGSGGGTAGIGFVIGGFAGLPPELRKELPLISMGRMTWTHSMARLLLLEQIYRATEIRKNSSYHKD